MITLHKSYNIRCASALRYRHVRYLCQHFRLSSSKTIIPSPRLLLLLLLRRHTATTATTTAASSIRRPRQRHDVQDRRHRRRGVDVERLAGRDVARAVVHVRLGERLDELLAADDREGVVDDFLVAI